MQVSEPDSLIWARSFVKENGRLPNALEYAESGQDGGGQCDCSCMGQCPLNDHGKMPTQSDRTCYTNQLRDFIAMASERPSA